MWSENVQAAKEALVKNMSNPQKVKGLLFTYTFFMLHLDGTSLP